MYKTLFILENEDDMMMVQIYVDDIIFGGTSEKLVQNFVKHGGRIEFKEARTPMSTTTKIGKDEDGEDVDVKLYRGMIGSLLYLTASRPDLCFSVGVVLVIRPNQNSPIFKLKKILRYCQGNCQSGDLLL
ncbi:unnamed protein product [Microthlaspi erraticum]|uniref:Reverse transcriptase Ty1/copia-type domain-containing protein n=1 Tax=Microthlaspi erraticum TaxID=1685480 RepID=A0A6D2JTC2_9BRAS|nr:unnamed protein product [Microthlaspi erraticum]